MCYFGDMTYEPVIGLEIHVELKTKTKMFCGCVNDPNERHPNMNICPVCMAHPGTLPVINEEAVRRVIMVGLAIGGEIPEFSQFDRKNYFYPDLPKGYQISQYKHPLVSGGYLDIPDKKRGEHNELRIMNYELRRIRITRVHLEEDTGRLIHDPESGASLVDFNRAGVPLMELVTEPDLRTGEEVKAFGEELQKILRYIGASDADMEKGQMRVEVNISLRPEGQKEFGTKVEIKNINSFKYAADAVDYEIKRQIDVLERGEKVVQETRGWNEHKAESFSQRSKESAHDYRYFPEPDLPPLRISREMVEELRALIPELPAEKRARFEREYALDPDIIEILARDKALADYYEAVTSELDAHDRETPEEPRKDLKRLAGGYITGDFLHLLKEALTPISDIRVTPENFAELILLVAENKISNTAAKQVLEEMFQTGEDPSDIINQKGLWQMSDASDLEDICRH
ncbi:MAG: aspartyl-tRNA(Asn)/glutamyl-tRNA (Gln) amidotransferase subunit B, partial [Parcubacteria group bacterium Gr01-1014_33]